MRAWYIPSVQDVQEDNVSDGPYVPDGHEVQADEPALLKKPGEQELGHAVADEEAPVIVPKYPAGQAVQVAISGTGP